MAALTAVFGLEGLTEKKALEVCWHNDLLQNVH